MTHTFEIKVQCKGQAAGTLNWLNSILSDGELVVRNTKNGEPGMFFHAKTKIDGTASQENECNTFICKIMNEVYKCIEYDYRKLDNGLYAVHCYAVSDHNQYGFVDFPLTPAAQLKCEEFLNSAVNEYIEWWNKQ